MQATEPQAARLWGLNRAEVPNFELWTSSDISSSAERLRTALGHLTEQAVVEAPSCDMDHRRGFLFDI